MFWAFILPSVLALVALFLKKLTSVAVIFDWVCGILIAYYGGLYAFLALTLTFLLTILTDKLKKNNKNDERRNIYQMISNVFVPTLCILLFAYTDASLFYVMFYATIGASLADTMASSIGSLSNKKPINILTLKTIETGESGGVSFLGLNASILGGIIIGLVYYIISYDVSNYLFIILMSTIGSIADSFIGAAFQGKYKCSKCGKTVEVHNHCNKETILVHGYKAIDNNAVNLLNNVIVFVLSYILLI